jgi:hypothetical protein
VAHIDDCVPGRDAKILRAGVPRVVGKTGVITEVLRVKRSRDEAVQDSVTVDVAGHGPVVVTPSDLDIMELEVPTARAGRRRPG